MYDSDVQDYVCNIPQSTRLYAGFEERPVNPHFEGGDDARRLNPLAIDLQIPLRDSELGVGASSLPGQAHKWGQPPGIIPSIKYSEREPSRHMHTWGEGAALPLWESYWPDDSEETMYTSWNNTPRDMRVSSRRTFPRFIQQDAPSSAAPSTRPLIHGMQSANTNSSHGRQDLTASITKTKKKHLIARPHILSQRDTRSSGFLHENARAVPSLHPKSATNSSLGADVLGQDLTEFITKIEEHAIARGGFGEVWQCNYQTNRGSVKVAVKSLLMYVSDQCEEVMKKKTRRIQREIRNWSKLNHRNILPLYGYTYGFGPFMALVSPWAENGNLSTYLEKHTTLTLIRRFQILKDIAAGLQHLHTNRIIHGDLNGSNVLIHADGVACLMDFGLSLMYSDDTSISQASWTSTGCHGNVRWLAPELLGDSETELPVRPTQRSDIYSFGGLMLQVLTGRVPYYYYPRDAAVIRDIYEGKKPVRSRYPELSDDGCWCFIERCLSVDVVARPSTMEVVRAIGMTLSPNVMPQDLTDFIAKIEKHPIARGGFGEIWKCNYQTNQGSVKVAVKSLLMYASDEGEEAMKKKTRRIQRELRTCAKLNHRNVLPVCGYTYGFGPFMAIVSPWAENGNLSTYLEKHTTLTLIRRFEMLRDIAAGLQYLHTNNIIHGDLNGPNVLIHADGVACLADFGLSLMYSDVTSISQASWTSTGCHGNVRWLAPELLGDPENETDLPVRPTERSDIYSFGGLMLQVLTGKVPYYYLRKEAVSGHIFQGKKPERARYPELSDDACWCFIERCLDGAEARPSILEIVGMIEDELVRLDVVCE